MTQADLATLTPGARAKPPAVQRFRDSHHMLARLFASGLRASEVALRTGYSLNRVGYFQNDPAFLELVASYRAAVDEKFAEHIDAYASLATSNMLKAERQIADRLDKADENDETLPVRELVSIARDAADRFGYGKRATQVNINADFASMLDKAIARSGKVIEAKPVPHESPSCGDAGATPAAGQPVVFGSSNPWREGEPLDQVAPGKSPSLTPEPAPLLTTMAESAAQAEPGPLRAEEVMSDNTVSGTYTVSGPNKAQPSLARSLVGALRAEGDTTINGLTASIRRRF